MCTTGRHRILSSSQHVFLFLVSFPFFLLPTIISSIFLIFLFPFCLSFFNSVLSFSLLLLVLLSFLVPSLPVSQLTNYLSFLSNTWSCQLINPHAPKQNDIHKHSNIFRLITYHGEIRPHPPPKKKTSDCKAWPRNSTHHVYYGTWDIRTCRHIFSASVPKRVAEILHVSEIERFLK